jgi:uncharacterized membrane protein
MISIIRLIGDFDIHYQLLGPGMVMNDLAFLLPLRWLHILSGATWFGLVVLINFVLLPAIQGAENPTQLHIINRQIFPRVFRLASITSATSVITGTWMLHTLLNGDWTRLLSAGVWGYTLLVGGTLAWLITLFHFVFESIIAKKLGFDAQQDPDAMARFHTVLKIVPRIAMVVLLAIFVLMMVAARGL